MEDKTFTIKLKCFFCNCFLENEKDQEVRSGDMLKCQNCNELNDYDALAEVAKEEGTELATEYAKAEIEKAFKDVFKKHKK